MADRRSGSRRCGFYRIYRQSFALPFVTRLTPHGFIVVVRAGIAIFVYLAHLLREHDGRVRLGKLRYAFRAWHTMLGADFPFSVPQFPALVAVVAHLFCSSSLRRLASAKVKPSELRNGNALSDDTR